MTGWTLAPGGGHDLGRCPFPLSAKTGTVWLCTCGRMYRKNDHGVSEIGENLPLAFNFMQNGTPQDGAR